MTSAACSAVEAGGATVAFKGPTSPPLLRSESMVGVTEPSCLLSIKTRYVHRGEEEFQRPSQ